ncbi:insulin receptor substrate 1-B [Sphaeramia orbicularis]|uniref:Insulin receptor substrate 1-B-like n=1 Tax=Sphaeramia orbicularis TaxID=375764 RepID=A0A673CXX9_9TELE|nr:insulin receptor substrate 1-B-like [Sphaeramia orbicularis]
MEGQPGEPHSYEDVRKSGYLRKQKSMHRRYFVLRAASERGPARLEYYESEKKFRGKAPVPKKAVALETCFNINKRADSKNKHMIVLYTRAESFAIAAENEADQDEWYQAMVDLQCKSKNPTDSGTAGDYGVPNPGPAFKEVWQVKVWPKGLGQAKNLVGIYRLCLTDKTVNFVKLNSDAAAVVLQLMNVRRCGHSENFFFVEVGRSAVTGPGEFWMQVDDSVVAQNMHETLLEAMKALSEEFRQRSKSQSNSGPGGGATASNPISVPSRRHHTNPPPSQVGFTRRPRTEPPGGANSGAGVSSANASPTPRHNFPRSRTASDGGKGEENVAGTMPHPGPSSSPSTNGSCSTTPILRSKSARSASTTAAKTPVGLMRSISTPTPSQTPNLSSSSGHGSEFAGVASCSAPGPGSGAYSRVPMHRASVSGSPSDYGSSDEYGSSPGDHALLPSPSLPGSSVGSVGSQSLGEEGANYILMGQRSGGGGGGNGSNQGTVTSSSMPTPGTPATSSQSQTRRVLRRSSSRECEAERRLLSKRASLPPMALERLAPRQRRGEEPTEEDSADYAIMSRSTSRESFTSTSSSTQRQSVVSGGSAGGGGGGYLEVAGELKSEGAGGGSGSIDIGVDNGYMSMLPGVTQPPVSLSQSLAVFVPDSDSKPADDYMAMTPNNSVSPPQQIRPPPTSDGYMIMSPNSSCSPDQRGGTWVGSGSADSRAGSDYMNMSPISARSMNGSPPPPEHTGHLETSSQQQAPKMVYSYYSLPRSYKHNPSGHFDDGPGRGRRPNGSCSRGMGGGRTMGGRQEQPAAGNSAVGRHLSLSSSSYSSSSASSESLGESEDRAVQGASSKAGGGQSKDGNKLQQRQGSSGLSKQGSHTRSRPVSLFVDVSKANTLPRVRENPLPPEPKSPGEYVSIEFKGEKCSQVRVGGGRGRGLRHGLSLPHGSTSQNPQSRPASCLGNFVPLSRSPSAPITPPAASEYVNMDLGPCPSPSPLSLTPLVFPSFNTPPTPPTLVHAPKTCHEGTPTSREEGVEVTEAPVRKSRESVPSVSESESPTSCGDYTEMAFSLNSNTIPRSSSSSVSPQAPSPTRTDASIAVLSRGLDFPLAKTGPNPDHGAKVIRADPQGRRRHCSETFLASPSLPTSTSTSSSSTASLFPEHAQTVARRLGFDSMLWGNGAVTDTPSQFPLSGQQPLPTNTSSTEQGLNYIDLDLANKESPHLGLDCPSGSQAPSRLFSVLGGGSGVGGVGAAVSNSSSSSSLNTYASIDFYKSEELRTHQNGNKEGTEC